MIYLAPPLVSIVLLLILLVYLASKRKSWWSSKRTRKQVNTSTRKLSDHPLSFGTNVSFVLDENGWEAHLYIKPPIAAILEEFSVYTFRVATHSATYSPASFTPRCSMHSLHLARPRLGSSLHFIIMITMIIRSSSHGWTTYTFSASNPPTKTW